MNSPANRMTLIADRRVAATGTEAVRVRRFRLVRVRPDGCAAPTTGRASEVKRD
jgi:hypothetical protein